MPDRAVVPRAINRPAITTCIILAVIMQALDTTIANVALPYMQGSVSASADQINWVLTSYIVAAAIMTPPSGFLANRFGRKRVLMVAIAGFVAASVLCGIAQSLLEIVAFRLLQGFFGAALVPIAQSILLDIYRPEERGSAMALFGVSVMVGPVLGPVIGGYLTDQFSWRWVFYINVPIGALAFAGISIFMMETKTSAAARMDWLGFGSLSVAIAAMQVFLDRGAQLDWFLLVRNSDRGNRLPIRLLHLPGSHTYGEGFIRESEIVSGSKFFGRNAVHLHRRNNLSGVAGVVDPVFADADGLPDRNCGSGLGAARIGHDDLHVPCRPPHRADRYKAVDPDRPAADGLGDVRHDGMESERLAVDDCDNRIHPGSGAWIFVRSA
jgi:multidrug resistance protein